MNASRTVVLGQCAAALILMWFMGMWLLDDRSTRPALRSTCSYNLRRIGMALEQYHAEYGHLPPAYVVDANGVRLHSWRVLILPYMDFKDIYKDYDLTEPWNGPNNSKLQKDMPTEFRCPAQRRSSDNFTNYVAVVGPSTAWPGAEYRSVTDMTDGPFQTVLLVELAESDIIWTEPRDLLFDTMSFHVNSDAKNSPSSPHRRTANVLLAGKRPTQGAEESLVFNIRHIVKDETPPEVIRALLTIDGGEQIIFDGSRNPIAIASPIEPSE